MGDEPLDQLRQAIVGNDWAYSLRWYADAQTGQPLCIDEWESVGPDAGIYQHRYGGFVDPSCLMLHKVTCEPVLRWWAIPLEGDPLRMSEDRNVFHYLKTHHRFSCTNLATAFYAVQPSDLMHGQRRKWIESKTSS